MNKTSLIVAAGMTLALCGAAAAQMGQAVGVDPDARAVRGGEVRTLAVGTDVTIGERIETGPSGLVELLFSERTKLVVGPGSALVIESYLLRSDQTATDFAVNALSGTFRFMSGESQKDAYRINTPTGTIGVRGTEFDFAVTPQDTSVVLYSGEATLCNLSGNCVDLVDSCALGNFSTQQSMVLDSNRGTRSELRPLFPYSGNQYDLSYNFRIANAENCMTPPPVNANAIPFSEPSNMGDGDSPPAPAVVEEEPDDGGCPPYEGPYEGPTASLVVRETARVHVADLWPGLPEHFPRIRVAC